MSLTKNLRKVYKMASQEHLSQGLLWYIKANTICVNLLSTGVHIYTLSQVVGAMATLSPQCSWPVNIKATKDLVLTGECPGYTGYKVNVDKARAILDGSKTVDQALGKGTRYGAKVRAFYDNILNPSTSELVTVDTHAIRAAYNIADVPRDLIRSVFESKLNIEVQDAYRTVAKENDLRPCQLQAIIWLVVKDNL